MADICIRYRCWRGHIMFKAQPRMATFPSLRCPCGATAHRAQLDKLVTPAQSAGCCLATTREECERDACPCNP